MPCFLEVEMSAMKKTNNIKRDKNSYCWMTGKIIWTTLQET